MLVALEELLDLSLVGMEEIQFLVTHLLPLLLLEVAAGVAVLDREWWQMV